jgi:hypothetical protein
MLAISLSKYATPVFGGFLPSGTGVLFIFHPFPSLGLHKKTFLVLSQHWDCIKKHFSSFPIIGTA